MSKETKEFIKDTISVIIIAFILAAILRNYVIEGREIPTGSMLPTVQLKDRVWVNRFIYRFKEPVRGDIVMFQPPETVQSTTPYLKRVIGLPGETVEMKDGKVYINGRALQEPYVAEPLEYDYGPVVVPEGALLVLGDNRNNSYDSHEWNAWLTKDRLMGKAIAIYWPFDHFRLLPREVSFQ
ncbi:MAG TPA: signal peptidase I [Syntrophomonadaceae bacterium]|jgi:signal peptidase I|nr:signal peptidase I [Syntrophomonadaceae bacterium]